jgi:SIR2-like protein
MVNLAISLTDFLREASARASRFMWFLGAGASRSALMPTANDLIWELKLRQYCREENQDIQQHDASNRHVRQRVQSFFDSKGAPPLWDNAEYSYYFEREFGADYASQQRFLLDQLNREKIALHIGHRALAAMLAMGAARAIFTTNLDEVIEVAFADVAGKPLQAFSIDGSYAALDALNAEQFPLYAKLHGDFRFRKLKNLAADLQHNDAEIGRAFLAAANRLGVIVTGYSGRDSNVMQLFGGALEQSNPFPGGLYWTVTRQDDVAQPVIELVKKARAKGVTAAIVEVGTFDILLMRLWQQLPDRPDTLNAKVRPDLARQVNIALPAPGNGYPLIRSNALPIITLPPTCGSVRCDPQMTWEQLRAAQGETIPVSPIAIDGDVLFWGMRSEVEGFIKESEIIERGSRCFDDSVAAIEGSTVLKGLFEHALACALVADNPVVLRKRRREFFAVASNKRGDMDSLLLWRWRLVAVNSGRPSGARSRALT